MSESFDVVIPTVGRPSLGRLLSALLAGEGPAPERIYIVDDRRRPGGPLLERLPAGVTVLRGRAAGPAAARNLGWRAADADWIAFLDDDVVPDQDWRLRLAEDLADCRSDVTGSQGILVVPMPADRRPTDWERNVRGLETARWATADIAYRRHVLSRIGGFDERFPRAYREDADLGLRITGAGYGIARGRRRVTHPVRPADRWISVRLQAGNADDALMRFLHGPRWRRIAGVPPGRRRRHVAITGAAALAVITALAGRRRLAGVAALAWLAGTAELAWARIAPGPRTPAEITTMLATSAVIPLAATYHWLQGWARVAHDLLTRVAEERAGRGARRGPTETWPGHVAGRSEERNEVMRRSSATRPRAVLFDRDGTLVHDVPYNGDPARVVPVPGAREAIARLRAAGVALAVVSNQSGVARGLLTDEHVRAVNARVEELLGPIGPWFYCPHGPGDDCQCRKPAPGLVVRAAAALGVRPADCAVIGDTGADVEAARAAGARAVLVPTPVTRHEEITAALEVAHDITAAVDLLLAGRR